MIVVVGLSHHTAPIELREQVALDEEAAHQLVRLLEASPDVAEVFIVSTCNRVEIVAATLEETERSSIACIASCRAALVSRSPAADSAIYEHRGIGAVRHLVRVASSLDSLVVGEAQILGQMKEGFELARNLGTIGPSLHQLFARASRGAKRVRSETTVGVGQVSVPSIAVDLALQIFGDMHGRKAVLIGLGEMGQTVARLLNEAGASLSVVGRDSQRVEALAQRFSCGAFVMGELPQLLVDADVVVSSTSAPGSVVTLADLEMRRKTRRGGNLFFIDLAVPRDIEPQIGNLDGVFLYDVDDLSQVAAESTGARRQAADAAEAIVDEVVADWERRESALLVTPTIKALRAKLRLAMEAELARSLRGRLRDLDLEQRAALSKMLDSGLNRLLHEPTTRLREEANHKEGSADEMIAVLNALFELEDVDSIELDVSSMRVPATDSLLPPDEPEDSGAIEKMRSETKDASLRGGESGESHRDSG